MNLPASASASRVIPEAWGVTVHFDVPSPGEGGRFASLGAQVVRRDLLWNDIEKSPGTYDFSRYDRFARQVKGWGARPLFILDYGNPLYDGGVAPRSDTAQAAFARFAAAAARHFRTQEIHALYEVWNEPQGGFWKPKPDPIAYARLATSTARAIHAADPAAPVLGGATAGFPLRDFLEPAFRAGLLREIDALSVHPYRGGAPEPVAANYGQLRAAMSRWLPAKRRSVPLPIVSSEWGWGVDRGLPPEIQAQYLMRSWMVNLASGVPLTIAYDWCEGIEKTGQEGFGYGLVQGDPPKFTPKPAYTALQRLNRDLRGYRFCYRIPSERSTDWRLVFARGTSDIALVIWSASEEVPQAARTPAFHLVPRGSDGWRTLRRAAALRYEKDVPYRGEKGLSAEAYFSVTNPEARAAVVHVAAGHGFRQARIQPGGTLRFRIALRTAVPPTVPDARAPVRVFWNDQPLPDLQPIRIYRPDHLVVSLAPWTNDRLRVQVTRNSDGVIVPSVARATGTGKAGEKSGNAKDGPQKAAILRGDIARPRRIEVRDSVGGLIFRSPVPQRWEPLAGGLGVDRFAIISPPGDPLPGTTLSSVAPSVAPAGSDTPERARDGAPGGTRLSAAYRFGAEARSILVIPREPILVPTGAKAMTLCLKTGEGSSGDDLRCFVVDSAGQTFPVGLGRTDRPGWWVATVPLSGTYPAHYGGPNDGVMRPPLKITVLMQVDRGDGKKRPGLPVHHVEVASPYFLFEGAEKGSVQP